MFMLPRGAAAATPSLPRSDSWSGAGGGFGNYESLGGGAAASAPLGADRGDAGGEPELQILVGAPEAVFDGIATDFEYPLLTRSSLPAYVPRAAVFRSSSAAQLTRTRARAAVSRAQLRERHRRGAAAAD